MPCSVSRARARFARRPARPRVPRSSRAATPRNVSRAAPRPSRYDGFVDLTTVPEKDRAAVEAQIREFGQTPAQLLLEPHPARDTADKAVFALFTDPPPLTAPAAAAAAAPPAAAAADDAQPDEDTRVYTLPGTERAPKGCAPSAAIALLPCHARERLVVVHADLSVAVHKFSPLPDAKGLPFTGRRER